MNQKNQMKENAKKQRVHFDMNLGERIHKDDVHLSRQEFKKETNDLIESQMKDQDTDVFPNWMKIPDTDKDEMEFNEYIEEMDR